MEHFCDPVQWQVTQLWGRPLTYIFETKQNWNLFRVLLTEHQFSCIYVAGKFSIKLFDCCMFNGGGFV